MNISPNSPAKRPSRLLDRMRDRAHTGGTGRLGFGVQKAAPKRHVTLVATVPTLDASLRAALVEAGADALEVSVGTARDIRSVADLVADSPIPLGLLLPGDPGEDLAEAAMGSGADWLRLSLGARAIALTWEKPARVVTISPDLDPRRAVALNVLDIDAVLIEGSDDGGVPLTIEDALRLAMLGEVIKKPLILHAGLGMSPDVVGVAEQCGADGLVLSVRGAGAPGIVSEYARALEQHAGKA